MNRDDQILSLLESLDSKATERHAWYKHTIKEHEEAVAKSLKELAKEINKLKIVVAEKNSETDKRMAIAEQKFESFKAETRRETVITRWVIVAASTFTISVCMQLVSWYAKQPPQDVNPVNLVKEITKLR